MEYSFLFLLMQKLWKSIKKCKTYSRKATDLSFFQIRYRWQICTNFLYFANSFCTFTDGWVQMGLLFGSFWCIESSDLLFLHWQVDRNKFSPEYDCLNRVCIQLRDNKPAHAGPRGGQFLCRGTGPWPPALAPALQLLQLIVCCDA